MNIRDDLAQTIFAAMDWVDSTDDIEQAGADAEHLADAVLAWLGQLDPDADAELIAWHLKASDDELAALRATIDNQSAEIGRLRELVCITSDALDHRTAWSGSCCMCTDEVCAVETADDALAALEAEMADR